MKSPTPPKNPLTVPARNLDVSSASVDTPAGLQVTDRATREEVLHRAYAIWEREGHPTDRKLANWLEAETEVRTTAER